MNVKQIDYIPKEHRTEFKYRVIEGISNKFDIKFKGDKAFVTYNMPYNITDEALSDIARHKKAFNNFLNEFRQWQFNYDYSILKG